MIALHRFYQILKMCIEKFRISDKFSKKYLESLGEADMSRDFIAERRKMFAEIGKQRDSKVLLYVTGDRPGFETIIHSEVTDFFAHHLDALFPTNRISLILYSNGGNTLAAWNLVNLLRMFCDDLEIIVPAKAHSAATIMCLGANRIVMTKQATLGPIDPSFQGPLSPQIPGAPATARAPVSVEAVKGYIEMMRTDFGISDPESLAKVAVDLAERVHPLVLGEIFRSRSQIQYLARQLLRHQVNDADTTERIINFLCSESGSHDYTINRREAAQLGLCIEKASTQLYEVLRNLYANIVDELELRLPFDAASKLGNSGTIKYECVRCLLESEAGGAHAFMTEGTAQRAVVQGAQGLPQPIVNDMRTFEGWRKRQ